MAQHCKNPAIQNLLMGSFYNADHGTLKSKQSLEAVRLIQLRIIRIMLIHDKLSLNNKCFMAQHCKNPAIQN